MGFSEADYERIRRAAQGYGADTSGWKKEKKGSMFRNWNRPGDWDAFDQGNIGRGYAAVATLGGSEMLGKGDSVADAANNPGKVWDDLTGKTAANEQAKAFAETQKRREEAAVSGQAATGDAVTASEGYLNAGQNDALQSLYGGQARAQALMGGGEHRLENLYNGGYDALVNDPGYQFRLKQGEDAIMRNFAARGGRSGGDAMKAISEYNQNFASNELQNAYQRAAMADQSDWQRRAALAGLFSGTGSQAAGIYTGTGSGLAGVNMQGAGINAGLTQSLMGGMQPPPTNPNPSGLQQLTTLGGTALGAYFGGPMGAAAGSKIGSSVGGGMSNSGLTTEEQNAAYGTPYAPAGYYK